MRLPRKYKIVEQIEPLLETSFEKALFKGACQSLIDDTNELRFNNFAYAIRELAGHVLNRLSPDAEVKKCEWYKPGPSPYPVTRAHRVKFAIQNGLSDVYLIYLGIDVEYYYDLVKQSFNTMNKFTHVTPATMGVADSDIVKYVEEISKSFSSFSLAIKNCSKKIKKEIESHIDQAFIDHILSESLDEIQELSTHQYVDEVYTDTLNFLDLSHHSIDVKVNGKIYVELQYGSNSDNQKGDGFKMDDKYPFSSELTIDLNSFPDYKTTLKYFTVDTSSFYE